MVTDFSTVDILMVDDDELDIELFRRTLVREKIANRVVSASNGIDALAVMRGESDETLGSPYIVLLDINMPKMSGIECLREIRADSRISGAIVFILTTSENDQDVLDAYKLNVAGYMVKSDIGASFIEGVKLLNHYWRVVEIPTKP